MDILKVDHIGIAVSNLDESLKFYEDILNLKCEGTEVVEEQKVKVAFCHPKGTDGVLLELTERK